MLTGLMSSINQCSSDRRALLPLSAGLLTVSLQGRVIHKGGGGYGASTILCMIPERKLACVVLNNHRTDALTHDVCNQVLGSYLPAWKMPNENGEPSQTPFVLNEAFGGLWKGTLMNDGISMPIQLHVESSEAATLILGSDTPLTLSELRSEGSALLANATGLIDSPDVLRCKARSLRLKVLPIGDKLVGRINAMDLTPDNEQGFPYVVSLKRT